MNVCSLGIKPGWRPPPPPVSQRHVSSDTGDPRHNVGIIVGLCQPATGDGRGGAASRDQRRGAQVHQQGQ